MTTQVYYRKWRPSSFTSLAGQDHVSDTLRNAISQDRISHSYLFCGPRGTGKTSTARVLAKAVNCLSPRDGDPCNACNLCVSANDGRLMDIIEMDAASNRGIDEIREIREKVNFSPVQGRRKIYIIDEAHMLTDQASNAFLKTLEEPPAHVIFILCTTEAEKILPTIVSRCQRHDFRRIPGDIIFQRLDEICQAEEVSAEPPALRTIARHAQGSLRDAENLLEQMVLSGGSSVSLMKVDEILGVGNQDAWLDLAQQLLDGDTQAALSSINQAAWGGADPRQQHRNTLDLLREAMLLGWGSDEQQTEFPEHVRETIRETVAKTPRWRLTETARIWGDASLRYDAPSTLPLEIAAIQICSMQRPMETIWTPAMDGGTTPSTQPNTQDGAATPQLPAASQGNQAPPDQTAQLQQSTQTADGGTRYNWQETVRFLREQGRQGSQNINLGALLRGCNSEDVEIRNGTIMIPFQSHVHFQNVQEEILRDEASAKMKEAIRKNFGAELPFQIFMKGDEPPEHTNPLVQEAIRTGFRIISETKIDQA